MSHIQGSLPHSRPPPALPPVPRLTIIPVTVALIFLGVSVATKTVFDGKSLTWHAVNDIAICALVVPAVLVARRFL